jgi:hypothetical protein
MPNSDASRRRPRRSLTAVWMASAFVLVVAFMVWLGVTSEPSNLVAIRDEPGDTVVAPTGEAVEVTGDELAENPAQFRGRLVEVANTPVAGNLGQRAVWLNLPGDRPFLVKLPAAMAGQVQYGQTVNVRGILYERTDSVLQAWQTEGILASEGDVMQVEFASDFIEAEQVTVAGGQQ